MSMMKKGSTEQQRVVWRRVVLTSDGGRDLTLECGHVVQCRPCQIRKKRSACKQCKEQLKE